MNITIARLIDQLSHRRKALVAAAGALMVTAAAVADGAVSTEELLTMLAAWGAVFGVHQIPNAPKP